jgi:hypothetical protein
MRAFAPKCKATDAVLMQDDASECKKEKDTRELRLLEQKELG